MQTGPSPDEALLPCVKTAELAAWLPPGDSVLVRRQPSKESDEGQKLEAWGRAFVLARLQADGARDCSTIPHPDGFALVSRTLCGQRLWVQARKPEN